MVDYSYELPDNELMPGPAPVIKRALAFIIDLIVFNFIIYSPFITFFQLSSGISDAMLDINYVMFNKEVASALVSAFTASMVLLLAYFASIEYFFGATLGKQLLGLKIESRGKPSLNAFFIRNLFKSLLLPLLPIDLLGILWLKSRQRFTDYLLGVSVLSAGRLQLMKGYI